MRNSRLLVILVTAVWGGLLTTQAHAVTGKITGFPPAAAGSSLSFKLNTPLPDGIKDVRVPVGEDGAFTLPPNVSQDNIDHCQYLDKEGVVHDVLCGAFFFSPTGITIQYDALTTSTTAPAGQAGWLRSLLAPARRVPGSWYFQGNLRTAIVYDLSNGSGRDQIQGAKITDLDMKNTIRVGAEGGLFFPAEPRHTVQVGVGTDYSYQPFLAPAQGRTSQPQGGSPGPHNAPGITGSLHGIGVNLIHGPAEALFPATTLGEHGPAPSAEEALVGSACMAHMIAPQRRARMRK